MINVVKNCTESSACARINGYMRKRCEANVGVGQGCLLRPWLFSISMDVVIRERNDLE